MNLTSVSHAVLVAVICASGVARADVLPPGHKSVRHEIVFEGLNAHPEYDFYLVAPEGWGGSWPPQRLNEGEPVGFYKRHVTKVCAVPCGEDLGERSDQGAIWPAISDRGFTLDVSDLVWSPVKRRLTSYRLTGVESGRIAIIELGTEEWDEQGDALESGSWKFTSVPLLLSGLAALVIVRVVLVRRRAQPE